ncbi:MAG TPA: hypothetical protein DEH78_19000 [Solibacterales bacterium]|nr:hypothetical protein [Bryobacterales bacterium]
MRYTQVDIERLVVTYLLSVLGSEPDRIVGGMPKRNQISGISLLMRSHAVVLVMYGYAMGVMPEPISVFLVFDSSCATLLEPKISRAM